MTQHVNDFVIPTSVAGAVSAATIGRFVAPFDMQILGVTSALGTAGTGTSTLIDVHVAGTTVFTTQANRSTIATGGTASTVIARPDAKFTSAAVEGYARDYDSGGVVNAGQLVEIIVDQAGTSAAGLTVAIHATKI